MSTWSHPAYEAVVGYFSEHTGLRFASRSPQDVEAGVRRAMARCQVDEVSLYLDLLKSEALPLDDLILELTVGETYFFREPPHFAMIRGTILPELMQRRGPEHIVRVWSAGCATGEEAYSLASVLDQRALPGHVLATDISRAALRKAREGSYGRWSLRGVEPAEVERCFERRGDRVQIRPRIAKRVSFALHNLAVSAFPSIPSGIWGMDLILCRNVLMYLERDVVARVADGFYQSLAEGGWLITGPSDPPLVGMAQFSTVLTDGGVLYRRERPLQGAAPPVPADREQAPPETAAPRRSSVSGRSVAQPGLQEARQALAAGDYRRAADLTRAAPEPEAAALHVRALASLIGAAEAAHEARVRAQKHPLSAELHFLRAALLADAGDDEEAGRALRCVLYLDRSLAMAHYLAAAVHRRSGRHAEARRSLQQAQRLAGAQPVDAVLPLSDGEHAGTLAAAASAELALLEEELQA